MRSYYSVIYVTFCHAFLAKLKTCLNVTVIHQRPMPRWQSDAKLFPANFSLRQRLFITKVLISWWHDVGRLFCSFCAEISNQNLGIYENLVYKLVLRIRYFWHITSNSWRHGNEESEPQANPNIRKIRRKTEKKKPQTPNKNSTADFARTSWTL